MKFVGWLAIVVVGLWCLPATTAQATDAVATEFAKVRARAEQGYVDAQLHVGDMYKLGQGVPKDYAEAARWYLKAAEQGLSAAQFNLSVMYGAGLGVPEDHAEAIRWLRKAAEQGDAEAQITLSSMYVLGRWVAQNYAEALRWARMTAAQGHIKAQVSLGLTYSEGKGVAQDYAEAFRWFRKAAEQQDAEAQFHVGYMNHHGQGTRQDLSEAVRWYLKAADQGLPAAQFNLSLIYFEGKASPQDLLQAHMWANLAAALATADTQKQFADLRDRIEEKMRPEQIAEAQRLASAWKPGTGVSSLTPPVGAVGSGRSEARAVESQQTLRGPDNEAAALGLLRTLNAAEITYAAVYGGTFTDNLNRLGSPQTGRGPDKDSAGLVDDLLAGRSIAGMSNTFESSGYRFTYRPGPRDSKGKIASYTIVARPVEFGKTGKRSFFTSEAAVIRYTGEDRQPNAKAPLYRVRKASSEPHQVVTVDCMPRILGWGLPSDSQDVPPHWAHRYYLDHS